jgi:hypothetical protein
LANYWYPRVHQWEAWNSFWKLIYAWPMTSNTWGLGGFFLRLHTSSNFFKSNYEN